MRGYGQYCPIALAAEVFAERWTPIIIRNLHLGCTHFGEVLSGAPGLPRSLLAGRLKSLERKGVVRRYDDGHGPAYELTAMGEELAHVCLTLGMWGARWLEVRPEEQDPYLALWTIARLIERAPVKPRCSRVVVRFDVERAPGPDRFWLVVDPTGNEVCIRNPGLNEDGVVTADNAALILWYGGHLTPIEAREQHRMVVTGPPWLERELARWGRLNPYAGMLPTGTEHASTVGIA